MKTSNVTMDRAAIETAAMNLDDAERNRTQIRHLSSTHSGMTIADAYEIQRVWVDKKISAGRKVVGHKVGLTSKAMQTLANVFEPDSGVLLDDMMYRSGEDIAFSKFIVPRLEVELAFVLGKKIEGGGCNIWDVVRATEYVVPALELLDARIERVDAATGATRTVLDTIADNAANCAVVMGSNAVKPQHLDLAWIPGVCYRNGDVEETGVSSGVLGHPAASLAWLANRMADNELTLNEGDIVLCGSFIRSVEIKAGDVFHADYGKLGSISCRFS